jgi:hypothetical protein
VPEELTQAGEDFGRAFCLSPDRSSIPLSELTPDEQACVTRVGLDFERRVQERMGYTPQGGGIGYPVQTKGGGRIATLGMDASGNVTLCLPGERCVIVGNGAPAAAAAEETLTLLGFQVGNMPTAPTG